jgi:hypothetical protein
MSVTNSLIQLQTAVAAMLVVDPVFNGAQSANGKAVPVITQKVGDIISYTQEAIAKMGVAVIIFVTGWKPKKPKTLPIVGEVNIQIQVSEFVAVNQSTTGTGLDALTLCSRILELLNYKPHGVPPGIDPNLQLLYWANSRLEPVPDVRRPISYSLVFTTEIIVKTI